MSRKTTDMDDIARLLGVSKTTVHYALRNTGRISEETRLRVLTVAHEMGYRPNLVARSLRSQRSSTLGVVVIDLASSYYAHVLEGIDQITQQNKYSILMACSFGNPDRELELIELLRDKGSEGLIVVPADPEANSQAYARLAEEGMRLVFVDRYVPSVNVDSVATDNLLGGYLAGKHLAQLGHKRIGFVTTISQERRSTSVHARLHGCNRALLEAGLEPAIEIGPELPDRAPINQYGYDAVKHYLAKGGERLDAIFAVNDSVAYGVLEALQEGGLRVPEDIAVVGFDDQDPSPHCHPPLTTIRQPMREIGEEAVRLLFRRLDESTNSLTRQRLSLEPSLVIRKSCGAQIA